MALPGLNEKNSSELGTASVFVFVVAWKKALLNKSALGFLLALHAWGESVAVRHAGLKAIRSVNLNKCCREGRPLCEPEQVLPKRPPPRSVNLGRGSNGAIN